MPQRPRSHELEDESRRQFQMVLPSSWVFRPADPDYGIDGQVEIFSGDGQATGLIFLVQLKGTDNPGQVEDILVRSLVERLGVFILTDSYLMNTDISYRVESGETLWVILKKFHAGSAPREFGSVAKHIAARNRLSSPDHILSGQKLYLSWHGINKTGSEDNAG